MRGPAKDGSDRTGHQKLYRDARGKAKPEQLTPTVPFDDPFLKIFNTRIETVMKEDGIERGPARYRAFTTLLKADVRMPMAAGSTGRG